MTRTPNKTGTGSRTKQNSHGIMDLRGRHRAGAAGLTPSLSRTNHLGGSLVSVKIADSCSRVLPPLPVARADSPTQPLVEFAEQRLALVPTEVCRPPANILTQFFQSSGHRHAAGRCRSGKLRGLLPGSCVGRAAGERRGSGVALRPGWAFRPLRGTACLNGKVWYPVRLRGFVALCETSFACRKSGCADMTWRLGSHKGMKAQRNCGIEFSGPDPAVQVTCVACSRKAVLGGLHASGGGLLLQCGLPAISDQPGGTGYASAVAESSLNSRKP